MFTKPYLGYDRSIPTFPDHAAQLSGLFPALGVELDQNVNLLPQVVPHALRWLEKEPPPDLETQNMPYAQVAAHEVLRTAGLIDPIDPIRSHYDHVLIDGGPKDFFDNRLSYVDRLMSNGLGLDSLVVFGGQRLRTPQDDKDTDLNTIAQGLLSSVEPWAKQWLEKQLEADESFDSPWDRGFATEHEIAILALLERYPDRILHAGTYVRSTPVSAHPSIPRAHTSAEVFSLEGLPVFALNTPAVIREHAKYKKPISDARPTGRTCFWEWLCMAMPAAADSLLLITHNPNIYRSWYDISIGALRAGRSDLYIEGAGDQMEQDESYGYLLRGLGSLLISFYVQQYNQDGAMPPYYENLLNNSDPHRQGLRGKSLGV